MLGYITGLRALLASQYAMQTSAQNIANSNTEGYTRQEVILKSAPSAVFRNFVIGTGVEVSDITRVVDELLEARIRQQLQYVGRLEAEGGLFSELEDFFGSFSDSSLKILIGNFFNDLSSLASSPQDVTLRGGMLRTGVSLTENFNQLYKQLAGMKESVEGDVQYTVEHINYLTGSIAQLNLQVSSAVVQGLKPSDLLDRREQLIKELHSFIDVQTREDSQGNMSVFLNGDFLVSKGKSKALEAVKGLQGTEIVYKGTNQGLFVSNGKLKGLLDSANQVIPNYLERIDLLAREIILEFNKVHGRGIGMNGPFSTLQGTTRVKDYIQDPLWEKTALSLADLPFSLQEGELYITVSDSSTGVLSRSRVEIQPASQSLSEIVALLDAIPHLNAETDIAGRVRISAEAGYGFDFSTRLDPVPDKMGVFGSAFATVASTQANPFHLNDGDVITLAVDGGAPQTVTFSLSDFRHITAATAEEVAAVINRDVAGVKAFAVHGRLVIQSQTEGTGSSLQIQDGGGGAAAALGLSTSLETGGELNVQTAVSGSYTGTSNDILFFVPKGSGTIGGTEGLKVDVFNTAGDKVAELDVGSNYVPGETLNVWRGVEVSFSEGSLDEASGEFVALEVLADSDTANFLPAMGLNPLFEGTGASDIRIRQDLLDRPGEFAASLSGEIGDNSNIQVLLQLQEKRLSVLGFATFEGYYRSTEGDLGFASARASQMLEGQTAVLDSMKDRRESISGVSVDEEFVKLVQHQKAFEAASRFIDIMVQVTDLILHLGE